MNLTRDWQRNWSGDVDARTDAPSPTLFLFFFGTEIERSQLFFPQEHPVLKQRICIRAEGGTKETKARCKNQTSKELVLRISDSQANNDNKAEGLSCDCGPPFGVFSR